MTDTKNAIASHPGIFISDSRRVCALFKSIRCSSLNVVISGNLLPVIDSDSAYAYGKYGISTGGKGYKTMCP